MIDQEDTKTWTKEYVTARRADCLAFLREINLLVVRYIEEHAYYAAAVSLEVLLDGVTVMQNSRKYGDMLPYLAMYSCAEAELAAFADPFKMMDEAKGVGFRPQRTVSETESSLKTAAIAGFEDARDFAQGSSMRDFAVSVLKELKAGTPADRIQQEYAPDFPQDIQDVLLDIDRRFYAPELTECAPERCFRLDEARLIFTRETAADNAGYVRFRPAEPGASQEGVSWKVLDDFDQWVSANGWDEAALEQAGRRVKLRRNLYGVLTFCTPLGPLLFPFWARALYLAKAIKYRDFDVEPCPFAKVVIGLYTIATLFVYPLVMLWVLRKTNWGMGLTAGGGSRLRVPVSLAAVAVVALAAAAALVLGLGKVLVTGQPDPPPAGTASALPEDASSAPAADSGAEQGAPAAQEPAGLVHEVPLGGWLLRFTVPLSWDSGLCDIQISEDRSVSFFQTASAEMGGWLFSLAIEAAPYDAGGDDSPPNSSVVLEIEDVALVYIGPTDVQFLEEYAEEYQQMCSRIPGILASAELERAE